MKPDHLSPWFTRGLALFGLALMLTAAIDLFTTVWPMRPADMTWRYGFLGLAAGYLQTPTLGVVLVVVAAMWQENVTLLRIAGALTMLASVALLLAAGIFALDVLAMRQVRPEEAQGAVLVGGVFQSIKYVVASAVLALLGYGVTATARGVAADKARRPREAGIVSTRGAPASG